MPFTIIGAFAENADQAALNLHSWFTLSPVLKRNLGLIWLSVSFWKGQVWLSSAHLGITNGSASELFRVHFHQPFSITSFGFFFLSNCYGFVNTTIWLGKPYGLRLNLYVIKNGWCFFFFFVILDKNCLKRLPLRTISPFPIVFQKACFPLASRRCHCVGMG